MDRALELNPISSGFPAAVSRIAGQVLARASAFSRRRLPAEKSGVGQVNRAPVR